MILQSSQKSSLFFTLSIVDLVSRPSMASTTCCNRGLAEHINPGESGMVDFLSLKETKDVLDAFKNSKKDPYIFDYTLSYCIPSCRAYCIISRTPLPANATSLPRTLARHPIPIPKEQQVITSLALVLMSPKLRTNETAAYVRSSWQWHFPM